MVLGALPVPVPRLRVPRSLCPGCALVLLVAWFQTHPCLELLFFFGFFFSPLLFFSFFSFFLIGLERHINVCSA